MKFMMEPNYNNTFSSRFFSTHSSCVRSVAFNPKDRYVFCSGGNDGHIGLYHAGRAELLTTHTVISSGLNRYISAVAFSSDGKKILTTTSSRRVAVIDVEHGTPIVCYDNCAYSGRDRTPLAVDPDCPNIAACSYVNGKGVTILDLRMPLPLDFIFDFHTDTIRDITFLHESWPFSKTNDNSGVGSNGGNNVGGGGSGGAAAFLATINPYHGSSSSSLSSSSSSLLESNQQQQQQQQSSSGSTNHSQKNRSGGYTILTLSSQGVAKVTTVDGRLLHTFDYGHPANSIAPTPEHYGYTHDGFQSAWICGGNIISSYVPNEDVIRQHNHNMNNQRLSSNNGNSADFYAENIPSQIHFNPTYNPNLPDPPAGGDNSGNNAGSSANRSSGSGSSGSNQSSSSWNQSFNVIISNPNNVNLNVYQIPRRNELIFGNISSIDSFRISRAIRSLVASSQQQVVNQQQQIAPSSSSSIAAAAVAHQHHHLGNLDNPSGSSGGGGGAGNSGSGSGGSNPAPGSGSGSNRLLRNVIQQIFWDGASGGGGSGSGAAAGPGNLGDNQGNQSLQQQQQQQQRNRNENILYDDGDESSGDDCPHSSNHSILMDYQANMNQKIDLHTPINSFVKKTLYFHDHWDHNPLTMDHPQQIWRLRFASNGAHLYAAGEGGFVRSFRRFPNLSMTCLGTIFRHRLDILDMDISPYDEYLVTASKDKTVGLVCLGLPSHGWTEYFEYT